jgi:hypothetical protein
MLPVSLDGTFLNGPLVFSNIYIDKANIRNDHNKSIKVIKLLSTHLVIFFFSVEVYRLFFVA